MRECDFYKRGEGNVGAAVVSVVCVFLTKEGKKEEAGAKRLLVVRLRLASGFWQNPFLMKVLRRQKT